MKIAYYKKKSPFKFVKPVFPIFYRKIKTDKGIVFWECTASFHTSIQQLGSRSWKWIETDDPTYMRNGEILMDKLERSNRLQFLIIMGFSPESVQRLKTKKVERHKRNN